MASSTSVTLVWGLYGDRRCLCYPQMAESNNVDVLCGWNPPASLDPAMLLPSQAVSSTDTPKHVVIGWTHAVLLTERGCAYIASTDKLLCGACSVTGQQVCQQSSHSTSQPSRAATSSSGASGSKNDLWQLVQLSPTPVPKDVALAARPVVQVAAGDSHCLLLDTTGCVWALGSNRNGQLGYPAAAAAAAAAAAEVAATANGSQSQGVQQHQHQQQQHQQQQQQQQQEEGYCLRPVAVLGPGSCSCCQEPIQQVAAGSCHSAGVAASSGRLYCWGWNAHGQCGTGSTTDVHAPTLCTALDGVPLASIAAGMAHTVAASRDGAVYTVGWNGNGQLGQQQQQQQQQQQSSSLVPVLVEDPQLDDEHVVQVACGSRHTAVLTATGRVFTWGFNKYGQCCTAGAAAAAASGQVGAIAGSADQHRAAATMSAGLARPAGLSDLEKNAASGSTAEEPMAQYASETGEDVLVPHCVILPDVVSSGQSSRGGQPVLTESAAAAAAAAAGDGFHLQQLKCAKAVRVLAGRWHTCIQLV